MKKILAFDSWTEGSIHLVRLVDTFKLYGFQLILIHVGSWGHDLGRPAEEVISGKLVVRDIAYYAPMSLEQILLQEKPDAVIFLSVQAFAHRAFLMYCRKHAIPTIHLYHGLVSVQPVLAGRLNPVNIHSQIRLVAKRLYQNLAIIFPIYLTALWKAEANWLSFYWFMVDVWRKIIGTSYALAAAPNCRTTVCCVYAESDVEHATDTYGMHRDDVIVVGNPDLNKFSLDENDLNSWGCFENDAPNQPYIVYVETALIEAGAVFSSIDDFLNHLEATRDFLDSIGYKLVLKLHPVHYHKGADKRFIQAGFHICPDRDFVLALKCSNGVIVEPSSAAVIAALVGCPVLFAAYGKLHEQQYGWALTSYPRGKRLESLSDVSNSLAALTSAKDLESVAAWISDFVGPLPATEMPRRVAAVVRRLVRGS